MRQKMFVGDGIRLWPAYCTKAEQKMVKFSDIQKFMAEMVQVCKVQFVLFEFGAHLALQLERSPLSHS